MKKFLSILMVLALVTALFVSCSQDNVGNVVGEDLVSISFATGGSSRTLTVSREVFDENDYIWCYTAVKVDNSGLTTGETKVGELITEAYVWGNDHTKTGLTGAKIEGISQGLWNFTLSAYVPTYDAQGHITGKSDVKAWAGSVTNQPVRKGEANVVNVTVSAVMDPTKTGTITFADVVVRKLSGSDVEIPDIWTGDKDLVLSVKATTLAGAAVSGASVEYKKGEGHTLSNIPEPKFEVAGGSYLVTFKVYDYVDPTFIYAEETIAVNVYSGLKTIIKGSVDELSSYVEFGEPVANAVIEAQTPSVIDVTPSSPPISFVTDSTQSTSYKAASIPAVSVVNIKNTVEAAVPEGKTLTDLTLSLNVADKGSTDAAEKTTKNFEISLDAVVTTTDAAGSVSVESKDITGGIEQFMTVQLYIGKELADLKVYHHDVEVKKSGEQELGAEYYEYDKTSAGDGILTLHVNHFSPFSVEYSKKVAVARLIKADGTGSDFYTLQEAFDAAGNGDTVALLRNLTESTTEYSISKSISFDGNAYTINGRLNLTGEHISISNLKMTNPSSAGRCIDTRGNLKSLVLDDVDLLCTGTSGYIQPVTISYSGDEPNEFIVDITIKDSKIRAIDNDGKYHGYAVILYTPVNLTVEDSDIEAWAAIYSHVSNATISVVDSKLVGVNENSSASNDFATIVFDGNSLWDETSHIEDNSVTISGHSEIIAKENGTNKQRWLSFQYGATQCSADVIIESTTVIHDGTEYKNDKRTDIYWSGEGNSLKISLSEQQVTELRAKMFTVEELSTGYYHVTLIPNAWYSNGPFLTAPGMDTLFVKPLEEGWMDDKEGMKLLSDITLVEDIACLMDNGSMYLELDGHSITGGNVIFDKDVCILCDVNDVASYFACSEEGYQIVVSTKPDSNGFYKYSFIPVSGSGTESDPWLIYDYDSFQAVTQHYNDADFHYWKCVDNLVINATDWAPIYLYGSIKGNYVVLNNLDNALIRTAKNDRDENGDAINTVKVSDMTLNCDIHRSETVTGLFRTASFDTVIENVKVSGVIEGTIASSYVAFGAGNVGTVPWNQTKFICSFINCISDAHLTATSENVGGFFNNPFCDVTGNAGVGDSLFIFEDSIFTGETTVPSGKKAKYFSYQGNALPIKVSYSDKFIAEYGNPDGTCYYGPQATREDDIIFVGNYPLAGGHSERSEYAAVDTYLKASGVVPSSVGTLPEKGEVFEVDCAKNANYAIVSFQVGPNDKDGHGNFVGTYMTERVSASGGKFTSDSIRYFDIAINPEGAEETGLVGNTFNIVNPSYGTTYGSANVLVIQYNSTGQQILSVTTFNLGTN